MKGGDWLWWLIYFPNANQVEANSELGLDFRNNYSDFHFIKSENPAVNVNELAGNR